MPLVPGNSKAAIRENIVIEEKLGKKKPKQAVAIALNMANKSKKKQSKSKKKGMK